MKRVATESWLRNCEFLSLFQRWKTTSSKSPAETELPTKSALKIGSKTYRLTETVTETEVKPRKTKPNAAQKPSIKSAVSDTEIKKTRKTEVLKHVSKKEPNAAQKPSIKPAVPVKNATSQEQKSSGVFRSNQIPETTLFENVCKAEKLTSIDEESKNHKEVVPKIEKTDKLADITSTSQRDFKADEDVSKFKDENSGKILSDKSLENTSEDVKETFVQEQQIQSAEKPFNTPLLWTKPQDSVIQNIMDYSFTPKSKPNLSECKDCSSTLQIKECPEDRRLPSVSRILRATMSPDTAASLARWEEYMKAKLGEEGFASYRNALLKHGENFHALIENFLLSRSEPKTKIEPTPLLDACWKSLENVLKDVKSVQALESHVVHSELSYRGYVDCIAEYKGRPAVLEWKHSEKKKSTLANTYDNPVQLMAYLGAINTDSKYPFQVEDSVLVIAYTDGSPAQIYSLTQEQQRFYWMAWLERVKQFWALQSVERSPLPKIEESKSIKENVPKPSDENESVLKSFWKLWKT